jgi:hypothetical protein
MRPSPFSPLATLALAAPLATGCLPESNLRPAVGGSTDGGTHSTDGGPRSDDGAPSDGAKEGQSDAGSDAEVHDAGGPGESPTADAATRAPCGFPQLLVGMTYLPSAATSGRVLRFHIGDEGDLERCADLTARGRLGTIVRAVAGTADGLVVAAGEEGTYSIDAPTDRLLFSETPTTTPYRVHDAFRRETTDGPVITVASTQGQLQTDDINVLESYDAWGSVGRFAGLPQSIKSATRSPLDPSRAILTRESSSRYAAAELDLATGRVGEPLVGARDGLVFASVSTSRAASPEGPVDQLVWVGRDNGQSDVYYRADDLADSTPPRGPVSCDAMDCDAVHAVGDPTAADHFFALCDDGSNGAEPDRTVLRMSARGVCEEVYADVDAGPGAWAEYLAIVPAP